MSTFADTRLTGVTSWDGLKQALHLRPSTIEKLQASDPYGVEVETGDDGTEKRTPLHTVWNKHGITTADARQLWEVLSQPVEGTVEETTTPLPEPAAPTVPKR